MKYDRVLIILIYIFFSIGYLSLIPPFEGFDEMAHLSRIREFAHNKKETMDRESYLDKVLLDYPGPAPYASGTGPFRNINDYENFFRSIEKKDVLKQYNATGSLKEFEPSKFHNWQIQHPTAYYQISSYLYTKIENHNLNSQIFYLRLLSVLTLLISITITIICADKFFSKEVVNFSLLIYPIMLPMFFLEFIRIGNDILCILIFSLCLYVFKVNSTSHIRNIFLGILLTIGIMTKAFFIPITCAFILVLLIQKHNSIVTKIKSFLIILLPIFLLYIFSYMSHYDSKESIKIGSEFHIIINKNYYELNQLFESFKIESFIRGILAMIATFIWAGTQSLTRTYLWMYAPSIILLSLIIYKILVNNTKCNAAYKNLALISTIFIGAGLVLHIAISLVLYGNGNSGGWYFHILFPVFCPLFGCILYRIAQENIKKIFSLLFCCIIFICYSIWANFTLYTGCSFKNINKEFEYTKELFCIQNIENMFSNFGYLSHAPHAVIFLTFSIILQILMLIRYYRSLILNK